MALRNITLMGDGSVTGGSYKKISVMGNGKMFGEIEADRLSIMGNLTAENNIKVKRLSISGDGKFAGVQSETITIMGNGRFTGPVNTVSISVAGSAQVEGNIKAKDAAIHGTLEAKHAEFERFSCKGTFEMETLNANDIKVRLSWNCSAGEIGGETIEVKYSRFKKVFFDVLDIILFRKSRRAALKADVIEADRIYLENTTAGSVKGTHITIGPGCRIKSIEYKDKVFIDKDSVVDQCSQE